jgi:hypothetical protein
MSQNIAKLAGLAKADILKMIHRPKAIQQVRGRYHVAAKLNTQLVDRALKLRIESFGVRFEDFRRTNVSVWDVSIGDKLGHFERRLLDSGNFPASVLDRIYGKGDVSVGFHSEGLIAQDLLDLQNLGKEIKVHQIYTERWPCGNCARLLEKYSETPIFHSLRSGEETRSEKLMEAYGIVVRQ